MRWLTEDALIVCRHELGKVAVTTSQAFVTVNGRLVLIEPDPENRSIGGCPNIGAAIKPCQHTQEVRTGYSHFVRIAGKPVVLDNLSGLTDGTPPRTVQYKVNDPGQTFVEAGS